MTMRALLVMEDLQKRKASKIETNITVRQIDRAEALLFAEVMVAAYEMLPEYAGALAALLTPPSVCRA
ncbi:MAG: hypothetical protein ACUVRJ_00410 [Candidatus Villigracilaceae bacterium]